MNKLKPIAFYLPQFHRVEENDNWWGKGFTEWTNVAKAKPNFKGHYQPHVPSELGFYDLENIENMRAQAELAQQHGIHGFCFYYYRFKDGRRILEKPVDQYLESDINFPFCYCWANENWTKTWDGLEKNVLLEQDHGGQDDLDFLADLLETFKDPRYIKVDGKPVLLVYRADLLKNTKTLVKQWRKMVLDAGFPGIHLCAVQFYGIEDPAEFGFDAAVEFPPHKFIGSENRPTEHISMTNANFSGGLVDYGKVLSQALNKPDTEYLRYRGIVPSWDNTARRQDTGHIFINSSPKLYKLWLSYLASKTLSDESNNSNFVFINAWNEWAEGAHLEPDLKYGLEYLEATLSVVNNKKVDITDYIINDNILSFLLKDLNEQEVEMLSKAFKLTNQSIYETRSLLVGVSDSVPLMPVSSVSFKLRNFIKTRFPGLTKYLLPLYLKLRTYK